ncbi:MAG: hypothetical protein K5925_05435 [Bacilli bacterium]|nr:hypothetical protein [Bacilli bacterium]
MAVTRVEKYKDYRKSILTDGDPVVKTAIETSLESTSIESNSAPSYQEAAFLRKLQFKKWFIIISLSTFVVAIIILTIVFGNILF